MWRSHFPLRFSQRLFQAKAKRSRSPQNPPSQLFVGTCYQPIDRSPEQIKRDIALMKDTGFNIVRTGDLSWDTFEPEEGRFTLWFEDVLRQDTSVLASETSRCWSPVQLAASLQRFQHNSEQR